MTDALRGTDLLLITQHPFPGDRDVRAKKLAASFSQRGSRVLVWAPFSTVDVRTWDSGAVRAPLGSVPPDVGTGIPVKVSPIDPRLLCSLRATAQSSCPQLVITRDLRFVPAAVHYCRATGTPFWLDLAENMPAMVRHEGAAGPIVLAVKARIARILEKMGTHAATLVTVVSSWNRDRIIRDYDLPPSKVAVLENAPHLTGQDLASRPRVSRRELRLVYIGIITRLRGLDLLMEAVRRCRERGTPVELDVWGDGRESGRLEELVRKLELTSAVRFRGWLSSSRIPEILPTYDAGVIPHRINEHTSTTIPNKAYDYMAAALPVIATEMPPVVDLLRAEAAGVTIPDSVDGLANGIDQIWRLSPEGRAQLGRNGKSAILERRNWSAQFDEVMTVLNHSI